MSAAMSPPHLAPQRARAFINHSPESYREAIGARAASRGSPRQTSAQHSPSGPPSQGGSQPDTRAASPLQLAAQSAAAQPELNVKFERPAEANRMSSSSSASATASQISTSRRSSVASSVASTDATAVNTPQGAQDVAAKPAGGSSSYNPKSPRFSLPTDARARRSDTMPAELPDGSERPQSRSTMAYQQQRSFSSSSGSESGSSQHSENEKRVKEFKDAPRKRRRTSPNELHILETEFARNNKPCKEERERIAATMGMDEKAVQVWFQNKRQSCRRQQSGSSGSGSGSGSAAHHGTSAGGPALRTQSLPMLATTPPFQDENAVHMFARAPLPPPPPFTSKPAFAVHTQSPAPGVVPAAPGAAQPAKRAKSLRLAMSADGKAELVERSPLKSLPQNGATAATMPFPQFAPLPQMAMRFASTPLSGMETECATSLLFLKSGHWP